MSWEKLLSDSSTVAEDYRRQIENQKPEGKDEQLIARRVPFVPEALLITNTMHDVKMFFHQHHASISQAFFGRGSDAELKEEEKSALELMQEAVLLQYLSFFGYRSERELFELAMMRREFELKWRERDVHVGTKTTMDFAEAGLKLATVMRDAYVRTDMKKTPGQQIIATIQDIYAIAGTALPPQFAQRSS